MSSIAVLDLAAGKVIHATPVQFAAAFAAAEASKHSERAGDALCASVRAAYDEAAPIAEGDYLYAMWGHEQTNIDWFQVTRRKGDWLTLQPCAAIETADQRDNARNAAAAYKAEAEELRAALAAFVSRVQDRIPSLDEWDAAPLAADCAHAQAILAKGGDGDMTGTSIPGAPDPKEKPIRRRVIRWQGQTREAGCKWKSYGWMSKWDGIPKGTSHYA